MYLFFNPILKIFILIINQSINTIILQEFNLLMSYDIHNYT